MNNKGFTLIEILAVIAILGIVMALATTSYSAYFDSINEKNKDNNIEIIKAIATDYFNETGNSTFFVNDLIEEGYLKANKDGSYFINDEDYKCYVINVNDVFESNNTDTEVELTKSEIKEDGTCNENALQDMFYLNYSHKGEDITITVNVPYNTEFILTDNIGSTPRVVSPINNDNDKEISSNFSEFVFPIYNKIPITFTATWKDNNGKITVKTFTIDMRNSGGTNE